MNDNLKTSTLLLMLLLEQEERGPLREMILSQTWFNYPFKHELIWVYQNIHYRRCVVVICRLQRYYVYRGINATQVVQFLHI